MSFCRKPLWDSNITWFTDSPDFTECFHETILIYIPVSFLLLSLPFEVFYCIKSRDRGIPWALLNSVKILILVLLCALSVIESLHATFQGSLDISLSLKVGNFIRFLGYKIALTISLLNKKYGRVTSGPLFVYWILMSCTGIFTFISLLVAENESYTLQSGLLSYTTYLLQYPLILLLSLLHFWADPKPIYMEFDNDSNNLIPEKYASFPSKIVFSWLNSLVLKAYKNNLSVSDLWDITVEHKCAGILPLWEKELEKEKKRVMGQKINVLRPILLSFLPSLLLSVVLQLLYGILQFITPQMINLIISFVSSEEPMWKGYLYAGVNSLITFLNTILSTQSFYFAYLTGMKLRTALTSAIYTKSLKLGNAERIEMNIGETTNLMAIDTQRLMDFSLYFSMLLSSPIQILLALYFLWDILGIASLAGMAVMMIMIPINIVVGSRIKRYTTSQMISKDKRIKLMDEMLNGMKVMKLYAWEPAFSNMIFSLRNDEIKALKKTAILNAFTVFLWTSAPFLVALTSFATYVLLDENNILDANTAFVSLSLFNLLRIPLNFMPMIIVYGIQCNVSLTRLNAFMNSGELNENAITHTVSKGKEKEVISVENANLSWNGKSILKDINIQFESGALIAIVGNVGSGKSSFLSGLLGEMELTSGTINVVGKTVYAPQQAWLQNASLRYNITFGKRYHEELYHRVLESTALIPDLEMLPAGDKTEIGENGINLSGGQKQRISLARSIYHNGDIYFLDDPLSAVDAHVGKHIFDNVIGPNGLLKNKTRLFVTHGVRYLSQMDTIVVLKEGQISEMGTYKDLLDKDHGAFAEFLITYLNEREEDEDEEILELKEELVKKKILLVSKTKAVSDHCFSLQSESSTTQNTSEKKKVLGETLIEKENMEIGGVKWGIYIYFLKNIGIVSSLLAVLLNIGYQGFSIGSNVWLSLWSTDSHSSEMSVRDMYLGIYGFLGAMQSVFIMIASGIVAIYTLNAATLVHNGLLTNILRAPMNFFDTTPLGRVLNRFSKDVDILDTTLPMNLRMMLLQGLSAIGILIAISIASPWFLTVVVPIILAYYIVQKFYIQAVRQVKRMESVTRSPIYSNFSETLSGISTIRAFRLSERFIADNESKIDANQICYLPSFVCNRWLSVRLEVIGNFIILFASFFAVLGKKSIDAGLVGLALSYAQNITGTLNMLVRMMSEVETNMISVERIMEYQKIETEAPYEIIESEPSNDWPQHGVIEFDNYTTRYRIGLDLVLKGVNCLIRSNEKVGIVGRTGAGKSSLTLALFRILEPSSGAIYIDGLNIRHLGLGRLRSRLTIIPQDPVLFSGTLRMNLDPTESFSDSMLWRALEHAHLKTFVSNLPGGLHFSVTESGNNLSVGQKQLICLARALLRKTKILILDEATASVDLETDDLIQNTIRKEFHDCTVLTIAHRINTILDCNRVMVLENGVVSEFDTPSNLLGDSNSLFYGMASEAGVLPSN